MKQCIEYFSTVNSIQLKQCIKRNEVKRMDGD